MKNRFIYFIEFLQEIRVSYKKYIGDKSLYVLNCYLKGFIYNLDWKNHSPSDYVNYKAIKNQCIDITEIREFFIMFQNWIGLKYSSQWQSWCNIIRFYSDNEEEAFETFFNELKLFCESDAIIENKEKNISNKILIHNKYGKIQLYGHNIDLVVFKKEQYNNEFYQKLWKLLTMIKNAPLAFIGEKSLSLTNIYIRGYIDSYNMRRVGESTYEFFQGFEEWVNQKAELNLYRPWYKVLIFLSVTEESAFDLLFDYLEEYTGNKFEDIARF